jgi:transposase-like protein
MSRSIADAPGVRVCAPCPLCPADECGLHPLVRLIGPARYRCPCCRRLYSVADHAWMQTMRPRALPPEARP